MKKNILSIKGFTLLTMAFLIHGCSPTRHLLNTDHKLTNVAAMRAWQTEGKFAFIEAQRSFSANFTWLQNHRDLQIDLRNSLGFGTATLTGNKNSYKLVTSDGQTLETHDGEALLAAKLGLKIPLNSLHYWLRGLVDPNLPIITKKYNKANFLTNLAQGGWHIEYASYKAYYGIYLPHKIYLTAAKIRIKIFIINWYQ